jgi:hypothetical protein
MSRKMLYLNNILKHPEEYCCEEDDYIGNPFARVNYDPDRPSYMYIEDDDWSKKFLPNPVGRALKTGACENKECHCLLSWNDKSFKNNNDWLHDFVLAIDEKGDLGICCYANSGKIGNIRDYNTIEKIADRVLLFREQFRKEYKIDEAENMMMEECCQKCLRFKICN